MNRRGSAIALIILTMITSGCMGGGGNGGSGLNIGAGGKTITVTNFEVQPREISAGQGLQINVGIANTGTMSSNITIGEDGKQILRNFCPDIFEITSFDGYSTRNPDTAESYTLSPGEKLSLTWSLRNSNTGEVPTYGYKCPLSMQIPFDYGVSAYQQIQVKKNREIQGSTNLQSRTSKGPLSINLETIGSTSEKEAPTFIKGDNIEVLMQLENTQPDKSSYQGLVNMETPIMRTSERFLINRSSCNMDTENSGLGHKVNITTDIQLYQGDSRVVRCGVKLKEPSGSGIIEDDEEMGPPSIKGQITANVNYTYTKFLGETEVKVEYSG